MISPNIFNEDIQDSNLPLLWLGLDSTFVFYVCVFSFFFFKSRFCWLFNCEQCICTLFTDPQTSLFSHFFIKNGSHGTIYTFKNYFATVFSVFSFSKISSIQTDSKYQYIFWIIIEKKRKRKRKIKWGWSHFNGLIGHIMMGCVS